MSEIILTEENFEQEVINSDKPVMVDFWTSWCRPCKMVAPIVADIAESMSDKIKVGKVNVDEQQALAARYQIVSIPSLLFFKDGNVVERSVGYNLKEDIVDIINEL